MIFNKGGFMPKEIKKVVVTGRPSVSQCTDPECKNKPVGRAVTEGIRTPIKAPVKKVGK